jgi:hypothetical protein
LDFGNQSPTTSHRATGYFELWTLDFGLS